VAGNTFDIYSRHDCTQQLLHQQQQAPFFPPEAWHDMAATTRFFQLPSQSVDVGASGVRVSTLELDHPSSAYAFRLDSAHSSMVYASDGAYTIPGEGSGEDTARTVEFFRDADLVIFDSQFSFDESQQKRAWGHSSAVIGVELARMANAKQLALFHHDPGASDAHLNALLKAAREAAQNEVDVFLAREELEVEL
jgi:ribonuclease BN (tRNA processing enzyme)